MNRKEVSYVVFTSLYSHCSHQLGLCVGMDLSVRNMARVIRGTPITGSDLGAALSLNKYHFSSEMLKSYANDPERYRFEVLHDWLVHDPNSSWERFAKALNQIGHRELANDVLAKYPPGTSYVNERRNQLAIYTFGT